MRPIEAGALHLGNVDVTKLGPGERQIGYVPQEGALFPRMTVGENLGFAMRIANRPAKDIQQRVTELAERLSISHLLKRRAVGLSGGEVQRVALGRALGASPTVLLLDEPLSALDESTRAQMVLLLKRVQAETGTTTLHVTHSRHEADRLADVLFQIVDGNVHLQRDNSPTTPQPPTKTSTV